MLPLQLNYQLAFVYPENKISILDINCDARRHLCAPSPQKLDQHDKHTQRILRFSKGKTIPINSFNNPCFVNKARILINQKLKSLLN